MMADVDMRPRPLSWCWARRPHDLLSGQVQVAFLGPAGRPIILVRAGCAPSRYHDGDALGCVPRFPDRG